MDNNVRFRKSVAGFNKDDVYEHIENLYRTFDAQLKQKDEEIEQITKHNALLRSQVEEMQDKFAGIEDYKSNIADVLVKAKEQGSEIIKEAEAQAEEKKKEAEQFIKSEIEKLDTFKNDLMNLKQTAISTIQKFQKELDELIDSKEENK